VNYSPSTDIKKFAQVSVHNANKALANQHQFDVIAIQTDDLIVLLSALGQALDTLEEVERKMGELQLTMMIIRQHV
jgi:hypothetical protein